jgi:hypothetical protein
MKLVNKIINLYFNYPLIGNLGFKFTGIFIFAIFILSGFDTLIIREVLE